ncbi:MULTISPECIES: 4-(cytidine 5'-diphospho)-2-C-methyl-D-erythritol kinase [unclassified Arcicella]|uniref:4-(cytidine 5'-diphospho)-2-C-methyl-D-erythritol kinase n=1 Tax=unclassified Arcicella TaxID=2644986 RepID=UPI0028657AF3|nr:MULTISPECIES: 4-(cytidine 5'-diphospho)-2-C-methyl-D-erythritol kinase [unclassified Arcicella]MDR6563328.1 4-diphosphocytidyl-2-C-methyl-D-erythritol kinase [Arcicella sp. BE51]MDR6813251.1 4-diphosphocytidyl-2-C-methyl-D-erythritol kinase [Arcicella sp. BE140]MDR6824565.1 4-diphosphocytidyl-2-C-methyl-D-erythritol kinase [Arcicella sp. BE139]
MVTFPNAKINIGLYITEKRADGFHNLESCFYPVGWCDILEILPADELSFKSTGLPIPGSPDSNLCLKAYHLLKQDFDIPPVTIHLHKVVPIGAGMGGGSADCAFTIKTLNELFVLHLSIEQMENYARRLGSDCAFFIQNQPQYCFGKGDEFADITIDLTGKFIVLVNPNIHISTAEAYSGVKPQKNEIDLREVLKEPVQTWKNVVKNDFETHLLPKYPRIENIKNKLYELGASYASMTGSGSTVFGIFEEAIATKKHFEEYAVWEGKL